MKLYYYILFSIFTNADVIRDNKTPKINAHKNPEICIPATNLPASITINTFITTKKIPNVRTVIGKVRRTKIGFNIALRNASTSEKIIAVMYESIRICGLKIIDSP